MRNQKLTQYRMTKIATMKSNNIIIRRGVLLFIMILTVTLSNGQNHLNPSQFGRVGTPINGVYSLLGGSAVDVIGRQQWVGMDGAPQGYWLNGYIGLDKIGASVGLDVKSHKMGVEASHDLMGYFAKGIRISENEFLGLSIGLGVSYLKGDYMSLDPEDVAFSENVSEFLPTFSIGTGVYSPDKYFVGISIPRVVLSEANRTSQYRQVRQDRLYSLYSVAVFDLGQNFDLKPALLTTFSPVTDLQLDVSALLYVQRTFGLGVGYRSPNFITGHMEAHVGPIQVGYSYQFGTGSKALKRSINNSTHELGVSYRFGGVKRIL